MDTILAAYRAALKGGLAGRLHTNCTSQSWFARRLYLNGKPEEALEEFGRLKLARVAFDAKVAIAGLIRERGEVRIFNGAVSRVESDHAWVTPDGQQRSIYLHSSQVDPKIWQNFRQGDALRFCIGFNHMGPAATMP